MGHLSLLGQRTEMKQLFRRNRRLNRASFLDLASTESTREPRRRAGCRRFESLESRLMLHNGPHAVDPDYDFNTNFDIEADFSIYVDSDVISIPNGSGDGIEAINSAGKVQFQPGPQDGFVTVGDFFDSWAAFPQPGSPSSIVLNDTTLFDNEAGGGSRLQMFVNGEAVTEDFAGYFVHDQDDIVLIFGSNPVVTIDTNLDAILPATISGEPVRGKIPIELRADVAPGTVENFLTYANDGDFDNAIFHRFVSGFVLQGGGFSTVDVEFTSAAQISNIPTNSAIQNEFGISNTALTIAMAKLGGDPDSATNQFFFNLGDNSSNLDNQNGGFTVFASVLDPSLLNTVSGLTRTNAGGAFTDLPLGDNSNLVIIESIEGDGLVSGVKFEDQNNNGVRDAGEPGLEGILIYSDANGNDQPDSDEAVVATDVNGEYRLALPPGQHTIREIEVIPFVQTLPDSPDEHSVTIEVGRELTGYDFGNFRINEPTGVDLLAESDSGLNDDDNVTNFNNSSSATAPKFQVSGIAAGETVRVRVDGVLAAEQVLGSDGVVTLDGVTTLSDGDRLISVAAVVNGTAGQSVSMTVTVDAAAPQISSQPLLTATVDEVYTYDAASPEEGNSGFFYSLVDAQTGSPVSPTEGIILDSTTGVATWTPTTAQVGDHDFEVRATDIAGNVVSQALNINVSRVDIVQLRLEVVDEFGNPTTEVNVGDDFRLQIFVLDLRATAAGVFSAYTDVNFDEDLASPFEITHGTSYGQGGVPNTIIDPPQTVSDVHPMPGLLDEVGSFAASIAPLGPTERLLLSIDFLADASGTLNFTTDPADLTSVHEVGLYNLDGAVADDQIDFGSTSVTILSNFRVLDPPIGPDEDSSGTTLQIAELAEFNSGFSGDLTITSVVQPANGQVTVAADGKSLMYVPNPDFFGSDDFEYNVTDTFDLGKGTVSVSVQETNDDPTAVDDSFEDATNGASFVIVEDTLTFLPVLSNDLIDPDPPIETLSVASVSSTSANGGTVAIAQNGQGINYTPATNFRGVDTFTYTIQDDRGGTSGEATVTVNVIELNDPPTAVDDFFPTSGEILEDSGLITLDVIANDTTAPDDGETITITAVSASPNGSIITIAGNMIEYTPASDFAGDDTFTYTISDGNGGTAVGNVTVTVTNVNDPPTANDDSGTGFLITQNTSNNTLDLLANDTFAPDINETLTITAFDGVSAGATVTISTDGQSVNYTPAADFLGTDTFTYTIDDGSGATDTATVTVNVVAFVPGSLTGYVYIDADNDGIKEPGEVGLEGVTVTLTGTDPFGQVDRTVTTDTNGVYDFENLAPGDYVIREVQPAENISGDGIPVFDGIDTIGSQGGSVSANDEFTITLIEGADGTDNNFGEVKGRTLSGTVLLNDQFRLGGLDVSVFNGGATSGTALFNVRSNVQGAFDFRGLPPNAYSVVVGSPSFLVAPSAPFQTTISDADSIGNDLSVISRQATTLSYRDFLTSNASSSVHAAVQPGTANQEWSALNAGWSDVDDVVLSLSTDGSSVSLLVLENGGQSSSGQIPTSDPKVQVLSQAANGTRLIRLDGDRSSFAQYLTTTPATTQQGEAEGEGPATSGAPMRQPVLTEPAPISSIDVAPELDASRQFLANDEVLFSSFLVDRSNTTSIDGDLSSPIEDTELLRDAAVDAVHAADDQAVLQSGDEIASPALEQDVHAVDEALSDEELLSSLMS